MKKYFLLITIQLFLTFVQGWFETCDYKLNVSTTSTLVLKNQNYPKRYNSGSSCKFYIEAPTGYTIDLQCSFDLTESDYDCQSQRLFVSREGDKDLNYAEWYCGYSAFTKLSVGNEISVAYTSNADGNGWFYCEAKAVKTTQDNCQCGWSKSVRN
jgi:hypothetical protein